ncbi:hypothetical protein IIA15_00225 [candidate division TA06 bacterium]|nr:hypothetical protein [candidate division TA06 bacterium]
MPDIKRFNPETGQYEDPKKSMLKPGYYAEASTDPVNIADGKWLWEQYSKAGDVGVYSAFDDAMRLHAEKNKGYRSDSDPLANFNEAPPVQKGLMTPLEYAYTLMSKQDDAVPRLLFERSKTSASSEEGSAFSKYTLMGGDKMLEERLLDGIVYRCILLAIMRKKKAYRFLSISNS